MVWVRFFLVSLGLLILAPATAAGKIERFTDAQGTVHITNTGQDAGEEKKPRKAPRIKIPHDPSGQPFDTPPAPVPVEPPAQPEPVPETPNHEQVKPPDKESKCTDDQGATPVASQPHHRTSPVTIAEAPPTTFQRVSWRENAAGGLPPSASREPRGTILCYQDRKGVIHITNAPFNEGPPPGKLATDTPAPTKKILPILPTEACPPALSRVSWPLPDPGLSLPPKSDAGSIPMDSEDNRIRLHRDSKGVMCITNVPSRQHTAPPQHLAIQADRAKPEMAAVYPRGPGPPSIQAWMPVEPAPRPPMVNGPALVARRDSRGRLHISNVSVPERLDNRGSPASFLGKLNPGLDSIIREAAGYYRLPTSLVMALIRIESNFVPWAISPKGAMGLMQLMPGTAAYLGVQDPFCPRENIAGGCRYFRFLLDHFQGSLPLALAAYNAGHRRVIEAGYQVPDIKETQEFVTQVLGLYYFLEKSGRRV